MAHIQKETLLALEDIQQAAERIAPFIHKTPLLSRNGLTAMSGFDSLSWKVEAMQRTGSFKMRGATNAVCCIWATKKGEQQRAVGDSNSNSNSILKKEDMTWVSHSSGNHGSSLARAAKETGIGVAHIVVPSTAPASKVAAMRANAAKLTFCEPTQAARESTCAGILKSTPGSTFVHPYDNPLVWAGQGTVGLEIVEQFRQQQQQRRRDNDNVGAAAAACPDVVIVPVGGGGLMSGVSTAIRALCPDALIIGAEPALADDATRSFKAGSLQKNPAPPQTIADGLKTNLSDRTFSIIRRNVDDIIAVSEADVARAMMLIYQRLKVVIEPSAGVGAAVALFHRNVLQARFPNRPLKSAVVVLCGGNLDFGEVFSKISKL